MLLLFILIELDSLESKICVTDKITQMLRLLDQVNRQNF